ncbi:GntR family transcriptional regulator [Olsenella sp. YH-ols2217]|uniref:GntR family transcriptional regulator n=1 Tax=Kribbibacterium absianum TaxID=3044210 RepID=A0ABT6ZLL5_9ACTN|nr:MULTISPECIES: GntR family transcriptional regulator [unclassified Olsenella]MDJ1121754.1 GntR family transcriptional regulator [Olsenella sp. YH-ols2216]MDJ1129762.1 GntR family transcriptional regulator [Olsenella sp. YH-ols2217]
MSDFERSDSSLLYVQVADYVREKIYSHEWGVDDRIPSEHELMAMLGLSRGTVQKGIRALVDEGLLVQQRGRGTYVVQPVMAEPSGNKLLSFAESMGSQGIPFVTTVVEKRVEPANKACAWALHVKRGAPILYLERVRSVFDEPVMFIESHVALSQCPGLEDVDFTDEGLFVAVARTSGRTIGRSERIFSARVCGKRRSEWLRCDEHAPALELEQTVFFSDGTAFEWGSVWLPANRCVISSTTQRLAF